jgi:hypothetical protein
MKIKHRGVERRIHVVKFHKKNMKKLAGINVHGETFELMSKEPMDYYVVEYRDDLR